MTPPRVAVLIPSRSPRLLDLCLLSHELFTPPPPEANVCVWVMDTRPGEPEPWTMVNEDAKRIHLLRPEGSGFYGRWCHSLALVAREEGAEFLVFQNDDTVVTPGWLDQMLLEFRGCAEGTRLGLLGACSNVASGLQLRVPVAGRDLGALFASPAVVTFFAMTRTADYFEVGGFDLGLPAHNFSDFALSLRYLRAGFTNGVGSAFIPHFGSQTFRKDPGAHRADMAAGKAYMDRAYPGWVETLFPGQEAKFLSCLGEQVK